MKKNYILIAGMALIVSGTILVSCQKDTPPAKAAEAVTPEPISFVEEFADVSDLAAKGWVIKNNSNPVGSTGWRQGRYEASTKNPGEVIGFPAFSSQSTPYEFVSVDAASVNFAGNINAWLITKQIPVKNGDQLTFWTRAMDDSQWPLTFSRDRMQVRANFIDGTANCGVSDVDSGSFTRLLLDINPLLGNNFGNPNGYPEVWRRYSLTISGLTAPVNNARFAFRYLATNGGVNGANASSLIGIDSLAFWSN
jgi:hypothetical protein